ncbi:hypothetical protein B0A50_06719 [Salinomyces thailandicus]|uniref:RRM domain-containing protein n=1 Tax=Salinomyces thailandicus TaxID=706561 RepID=A0A4V5N3P4_9PEZI|nr:hypothetical protein B0A50_06719 [Salinomyces thailandica]
MSREALFSLVARGEQATKRVKEKKAKAKHDIHNEQLCSIAQGTFRWKLSAEVRQRVIETAENSRHESAFTLICEQPQQLLYTNIVGCDFAHERIAIFSMQSIRQVERLNDIELQKVVPPNASWHTDYRDTAYIYIGGLPFELSEGDILTILSQYGNPVHINLVRDKETGKSRGFCFLKYEDQRSCDLAVDNLSGASVMGRMMSVDHTRYKKKEGEIETVGDNIEDEGDETDKEGTARSKRRKTESESEEERPTIKEEVELAKLKRDMDDDDPMKGYMVKEKQAEVEEALKAVSLQKAKGKDSEVMITRTTTGGNMADRTGTVQSLLILARTSKDMGRAGRAGGEQRRQSQMMIGVGSGEEIRVSGRCLIAQEAVRGVRDDIDTVMLPLSV